MGPFIKIKKYSPLVILFFMTLACFISVHEYRKTHRLMLDIDADRSFEAGLKDFTPNADPLNPDDSLDLDNGPLLTKTRTKTKAQKNTLRTLQLSRGDTLKSLLIETGASANDIDQIIGAIQRVHSVKRIKTGQTFIVNSNPAVDSNAPRLKSLEFNINDSNVVIVSQNAQGGYDAKVEAIYLKPSVRQIEGQIHSSFYATALKRGVPQNIVKEAISALSYVMNFQHGIKKNDMFKILFEEQYDRHGQLVKTGNLKYIYFMAGKKEHRIYRHVVNGRVGYYDEKGRSIVTGLLQTPLDASKMRVTSGYGMRLHPIKGYNKYHKGVDLGAPTGTAIKAAGDGIIVKYGYYGEYGNFVKIRHANGYETAYGHLSCYQKGLSVGSHVKQNQVIGYVGATGSVTGPHLHFEVIHKGVNVNPMSVKKMPSVQLVGKDLEKFKKTISEVDTHLVSAKTDTRLAALPVDKAQSLGA